MKLKFMGESAASFVDPLLFRWRPGNKILRLEPQCNLLRSRLHRITAMTDVSEGKGDVEREEGGGEVEVVNGEMEVVKGEVVRGRGGREEGSSGEKVEGGGIKW